MKFIADLHIHSHFSIATSKQLCPELLDHWGRIKGIRVIGTGDFTHPGWVRELKDKLEPAEQGLYRLKPDLHVQDQWTIPESVDSQVRFMLTSEISSIYKRDGKVRKVHNVLFAPNFEIVDRIQAKLASLDFNITSDGRPILGLDSRDLFELVLDISDQVFLLPAHIWTPWFSALGAKSGFDSIEDCYGDLTPHISAVETGLSSDPAMNWLCSRLDKYTLLSNSDAHSPEKLGREANLFDTDLSYHGMIDAIRKGDLTHFLGTVEFFPQEGKYHHDGHRKCGINWLPEETIKNNGLCPVCGKPVVVGVLNRVMQLADRNKPDDRPNRHPFHSVIPLKELLSEIQGVGPNSKSVVREYASILQKLGPELDVLLFKPEEEIKRIGQSVLAEGIRRMRSGKVHITAGYDGEYGIIRAFKEGEVKRLKQVSMFAETVKPESNPSRFDLKIGARMNLRDKSRAATQVQKESKPDLNPSQTKAVRHFTGPALIIAGPGTGKTRVLTHRIAFLINERQVRPEHILALTFTNKAADEIRERLKVLLLNNKALDTLTVSTFHALGYRILRETANVNGRNEQFAIIDEEERTFLLRKMGCAKQDIKSISTQISEIKQSLTHTADIGDTEIALHYEKYEGQLRRHNLFDLDDLIAKPVELFHHHPTVLKDYQARFQWILVDEYQDINFPQHQLLQTLMPQSNANLFAIGDPNQAIYGFRGADVHFIRQFALDYPSVKTYQLDHSYRCSDTILKASSDVLENDFTSGTLHSLESGLKIRINRQPTDKSEAEYIARTIESMMGGLRFFSMDSDITPGHDRSELSLSDFAVLCRTSQQMQPIQKAFRDHAIPYQTVEEISFLKREPVKSIIALFKASINPDGFFTKEIEPVPFGAFSEKSVEACIRIAIQHLKLDESGADLQRLLELSLGHGKDLDDFVKRSVLGSPIDTCRPSIEAVSLLTMHASKGLEFECVFIPGCEEGLIPYALFDRDSDRAEERRLLYVAMTRSKIHLVLTHADKRHLRGRELNLKRSPFLDTIETVWIDYQEKIKRHKKPEKKQLRLFD